MKCCVMTPSKSQILIVEELSFNEERTAANLIFQKSTVGQIDLTKCTLKKLDRTDNNMDYYEVIEN